MSTNAATALRRVLSEVEAASKLMSNKETVVQDITNSSVPAGGGGTLRQTYAKRVSKVHEASVDAMLSEVCNRLLGKKMSEPSTPGEASVWAEAASFFHQRIQASDAECPGRKADMSVGAATALRKVLAQVPSRAAKTDSYYYAAAQALVASREKAVLDITTAVHQAPADSVFSEVIYRLFGKPTSKPLTPAEGKVWAQAAAHLSGRIQGYPGMSASAAAALKTVFVEMEAAHLLMSNRERVVNDICNPGPKNIDGKSLTQQGLIRVDMKYQAPVDAMIREVCGRLLGKGSSTPPSPEAALVWAAAATYFSGRIQASPNEMPGRTPDMSANAAAALRKVLAQLGA